MADKEKKTAEQAEELKEKTGESQGFDLEALLKRMADLEKKLDDAEKKAEAATEKADEAKKEKELTEGQKKALMERRFHEAMEEAKQETVEIFLPVDRRSEDQDVFVSVNGYDYLIKRGEKVRVPVFVAKALDNSEKQKTDAYNHMKGLQKKVEDKELA
ncbi:hypothetical protein [Anaerotignum sp.]